MDAFDGFDACVVPVVVRQDHVVCFELRFNKWRLRMDEAIRCALVREVGVDLDDRSGRRFESKGTLAEPVDADVMLGDVECFECVHS